MQVWEKHEATILVPAERFLCNGGRVHWQETLGLGALASLASKNLERPVICKF